jgi:hypothetical protein
MSNQQEARIDLHASGLLIWHLENQGHPLTPEQRASAAALRTQVCDAPWTSAEQRSRAQILVLRLEMLLRR